MKQMSLSPTMRPPFSVQFEVLDAALPYRWDLYTNPSVGAWEPSKVHSGSQDAWFAFPVDWPARGYILNWAVAVLTYDPGTVSARVRATLKDVDGRMLQVEDRVTVSKEHCKFDFSVEIA